VEAGRMLLQLSRGGPHCASYQTSNFGTLPVLDAPPGEALAVGETR
jgi:hypothetical protein